MRHLCRCTSALLVLCLAAAALGQTAGAPFPVTNTRYGTAPGDPLLRSDGKGFFLFWKSDGKVRATKLVEGQDRAGHVIFDSEEEFDVAWTGTHFLAVGRVGAAFVVRQLDADAHPTGVDFPVAQWGGHPRIASNGTATIVVYQPGVVQPLASNGAPTGASRTLPLSTEHAAIAASGNGFVIALNTESAIEVRTLDATGATTSTTSVPVLVTSATIASNGSRHLLAWSDEGKVLAVLLDAQGIAGATLRVDTLNDIELAHPDAVWNGDGWTIAYRHEYGSLRAAHLDRSATRVLAHEELGDSPQPAGPSIATTGTRTLVAWKAPAPFGPAMIASLPLTSAGAREASFAATQQTLLTTAASSDATLVVWHDRTDGKTSIRAGVRTSSGNWSEQEIATGDFSLFNFPMLNPVATAASDGRNFVVLLESEAGGVTAIFLGERATRTRAPLHVSNQRGAVIAWNGQHYGIVSRQGAHVLTTGGMLTGPIPIVDNDRVPRSLTSDGSGFLLTTGVQFCPIFVDCWVISVFATRLRPDLQRAEATDIVLSATEEFDSDFTTGVVWTGTEYATAWRGIAATTSIGRIAPAPGGAVTIEKIAEVFPNPGESPILTAIAVTGDGGIVLGARKSEGKVPTSYATFLDRESAVLRRVEIQRGTARTSEGKLARLPGGKVAYVASSRQDGSPHDGTSHVMMSILGPNVPARPPAPRVSVSESATHLTIAWTAPPATVNGYRVEYRSDDGSWIELEKWFTAGELQTSIRKRTPGTTIAARVRAFNDGGVSDYSNIGMPKPPVRRRAVR